MAIPDFQSVMRPVLATVQDGVPLALNELRERVAEHFQLTEEERKERLPSGHQTVINNRVRVGPLPQWRRDGNATSIFQYLAPTSARARCRSGGQTATSLQRRSVPRPFLMQYVPGTAMTTQTIGPTPMI